jgi:arginase family enzyme
MGRLGLNHAPFSDPYDFAYSSLRERLPSLPKESWYGKMPIDPWLTPTPRLDDLPLLAPEVVDLFMKSNGCKRHMDEVRGFVEELIFPCRPFLIGVDHCSTGGCIMALAKRFPDLNVIILDSHFDVMDSLDPDANPSGQVSPCHCGNFLLPLLEEAVIRPENLWVLGVNEEFFSGNGAGARCAGRGPAEWAKLGVHLLSKEMLPSGLHAMRLTGPVYLSIDLDVGSLSSIFAARFMNCCGLDRPALLRLLSAIRARIDEDQAPIAGMDLMELDVHFLGASSAVSIEDCTEELFLKSFELFFARVS